MSPLIHKSMTWAIVSTVVLTSGWLANSVQDKHERGGFRLPLAQQKASSAPSSTPPANLHACRLPRSSAD